MILFVLQVRGRSIVARSLSLIEVGTQTLEQELRTQTLEVRNRTDLNHGKMISLKKKSCQIAKRGSNENNLACPISYFCSFHRLQLLVSKNIIFPIQRSNKLAYNAKPSHEIQKLKPSFFDIPRVCRGRGHNLSRPPGQHREPCCGMQRRVQGKSKGQRRPVLDVQP